MLEFIISNYILFIVAAIVLLLGLFGYMMDKKKYKQYREEIVNEARAVETMEYQPDIQNVATPVSVDNVEQVVQTQVIEPSEPIVDNTPQVIETVSENAANVPEINQN